MTWWRIPQPPEHQADQESAVLRHQDRPDLSPGSSAAPVNHRLEVVGKDRQPIPGLYAAGLTAGGTNGEGIFNATVLSNLGLAFSTGWIADDNATTAATPAYQPAGMIIESEAGAQRMLNKLDRHYPSLGAFVLKTGFRLTALRQGIRKHN